MSAQPTQLTVKVQVYSYGAEAYKAERAVKPARQVAEVEHADLFADDDIPCDEPTMWACPCCGMHLTMRLTACPVKNCASNLPTAEEVEQANDEIVEVASAIVQSGQVQMTLEQTRTMRALFARISPTMHTRRFDMEDHAGVMSVTVVLPNDTAKCGTITGVFTGVHAEYGGGWNQDREELTRVTQLADARAQRKAKRQTSQELVDEMLATSARLMANAQ